MLTVEVIKDMKLEWPRIETPDAWITLGIDRDLNVALDLVKAETTTFLMEQRKVGKEQAEKMMLATWDCRITQVVDVKKVCIALMLRTRDHSVASSPCRIVKTGFTL